MPAPVATSGFLGLGVDDRFDGGRGVRVVAVHPRSPAALAGLRPQDLLVAIDGQPVTSRADFGRIMNALPPGRKVALEFTRGDLRQRFDVLLAARPAELNAPPPAIAAPAAPGSQPGSAASAPNAAAAGQNAPSPLLGPPAAPGPPLLGVRTMPVSQAMQRQLGLPHRRGAFVADVVPGSPAEAAGVPIGAVIWSFNRADIDNPSDLARAITQAGPGARVLLTLNDRGQVRRISAVLAGSRAAPQGDLWRAAEPPAAQPEPAADAASVAILKDEIARLQAEVERLQAELRAARGDRGNSQP
jgi:S1-C subfamily serine protease